VVAKTVRDRWMRRSDRQHPGYGFERNKGYGTREHLGALEQLGPSRIHRRSFTPVASWSI
jgi:ribonuclease HII